MKPIKKQIKKQTKKQLKKEVKKQKQHINQEGKQVKMEHWQGPMIPAAKVSPEVIEILRTTKVPELIIPSHTTIPDAAQIYFTQYLKLFSYNRQLNADLIQTFEQRNKLAEKYNELKVQHDIKTQREENECDQTIRRKRRFANEIRRDFPCPSSNCHKSYGSEGSLTQHVKLKHDAFYKSGQYEILLQKMLDQMSKHIKQKRQQMEPRQKRVKVKVQRQQQILPKKQQESD